MGGLGNTSLVPIGLTRTLSVQTFEVSEKQSVKYVIESILVKYVLGDIQSVRPI